VSEAKLKKLAVQIGPNTLTAIGIQNAMEELLHTELTTEQIKIVNWVRKKTTKIV